MFDFHALCCRLESDSEKVKELTSKVKSIKRKINIFDIANVGDTCP